MINPFQQAGALKKAWDLQRELQKEEYVVEKNGVKVVMNGLQQIKMLETNGRSDEDIKHAINEAILTCMKASAKMLSQMGGDLQGLLGGKQ